MWKSNMLLLLLVKNTDDFLTWNLDDSKSNYFFSPLHIVFLYILDEINNSALFTQNKSSWLPVFGFDFSPAIANVATQAECSVEAEQIAAIWYGRPIYRAAVKVANVANVGWSCQPVLWSAQT